jgi:hypothetical protein
MEDLMWTHRKSHVAKKRKKRGKIFLTEELIGVNLITIALNLTWIMIQEIMIGVTDSFLVF